jgi:hypothetical protein
MKKPLKFKVGQKVYLDNKLYTISEEGRFHEFVTSNGQIIKDNLYRICDNHPSHIAINAWEFDIQSPNEYRLKKLDLL